MKHGIEKCRVCENYLRGIDTCKYCSFEWAKEYPPTIDTPYDIFDIDDDIEWGHLQLLDRLHYKGIDCFMADIWFDNNLAILIGCNASSERIADALHISKECIYNHSDHSFVLLNLFMEKYYRGMLDKEVDQA